MPLKTNKYYLPKLLSLILLCIFLKDIYAQDNDTIVPVTVNPKKILRKIDIRKSGQSDFNYWQDEFKGHWAGIDFGFNAFLNQDYGSYSTKFMDNDILQSNSTYINLIQQNIRLQKNRNTLGMVTGIGLHLRSYRLDQNTTIETTSNDVIKPKTLFFDRNQKSKLSIVSAYIPLLVEYQIPVNHYDNRIYFSAGPYLSYRLSSHTKIKYRKERKEKLKVPDDFSLHSFKYGIMVRAGYRWINVFASYEPMKLFKENKGPELAPFNFGITLFQF